MSSTQTKHFLEEEVSFTGKFSKAVFQTIYVSFRPFLWRVIFLLIMGLLGRLTLLLSTNVLGYWADSLCQKDKGGLCASVSHIPAIMQGFGNSDFVTTLVILLGAGFLTNTIFRIAISRTGAQAVSILYDEVTMRTSRLPMNFFDTTPVGRIISRFSSDYGAVFRMAGGPLGEFLCLVFDLIVMVFLTMAASVYFVPLVIGVVIANVIVYRFNVTFLRQERRAMSRVRGPTIAHYAETAQGASSIRVFGKQANFTIRFGELIDELILQRVRTALAVHGFSLQMTTLTAAVLLITGLLGIWLIGTGRASVGSVGVAFTFIMMTSTTIQQFFEWLANLEEALTSVERLDNYLRRPLEPGALLPATSVFNLGEPRETEATVKPKLHGNRGAEVKIEDLWLRYRADLPPVLCGIDCTIKPGEQLAIVGRTGSGKSSLIQALFHLYPFEKGRIIVDKHVAQLDAFSKATEDGDGHVFDSLALFRHQLALIPQEPSLFRGTVRDNLTQSSELKDEDLWATLDKIGIGSWIRRLGVQEVGTALPTGLSFPVEERGANLSVGERQLLCMARAMLQGAPVIIMDEATSSIDPDSEKLLVQAMQEALDGRTRIIVAHRLSTITACDRVLWLDQGKVRMIGTPAEVLPLFSSTAEQ